jgi:hypothetical protein
MVRYPGSVDRREIVDTLFSLLARGLLTRAEADKAAGRKADPPAEEKG